jgi:hypothetical protein
MKTVNFGIMSHSFCLKFLERFSQHREDFEDHDDEERWTTVLNILKSESADNNTWKPDEWRMSALLHMSLMHCGIEQQIHQFAFKKEDKVKSQEPKEDIAFYTKQFTVTSTIELKPKDVMPNTQEDNVLKGSTANYAFRALAQDTLKRSSPNALPQPVIVDNVLTGKEDDVFVIGVSLTPGAASVHLACVSTAMSNSWIELVAFTPTALTLRGLFKALCDINMKWENTTEADRRHCFEDRANVAFIHNEMYIPYKPEHVVFPGFYTRGKKLLKVVHSPNKNPSYRDLRGWKYIQDCNCAIFPKVYDLVTIDHPYDESALLHYVVMELLDHPSYSHEPIELQQLQTLYTQVVALHEEGFRFGDIRPYNILFGVDGVTVKLIDHDWTDRVQEDGNNDAKNPSYPLDLNSTRIRDPCATGSGEIEADHDLFSLTVMISHMVSDITDEQVTSLLDRKWPFVNELKKFDGNIKLVSLEHCGPPTGGKRTQVAYEDDLAAVTKVARVRTAKGK